MAKRTASPGSSSLTPPPRSPALVSRAAFAATLTLLGCQEPPANQPPMVPPGPRDQAAPVATDAGAVRAVPPMVQPPMVQPPMVPSAPMPPPPPPMQPTPPKPPMQPTPPMPGPPSGSR